MKILSAILTASLSFAAPSAAQRPTIVVDAADALIDQPVSVGATGLPPGRQVILRSYIRADSANVLVAEGTYVSDTRGEVRLERDASTAGTYTGTDAMGLFWSGRYRPVVEVVGVAVSDEALEPPRPMRVLITASVGDTVVAQRVVNRRFEAGDVRAEMVRSGDVVGQLFLPSISRAPAVIVLSGSEGGFESSAYQARMLAAQGFVAFAQAYFGADGLGSELASIPIERVKRGIDYLRGRGDVDAERVALMSGSRGTELAMLVANYFPLDVSKVVLYGTSVTTGSGLTSGGQPHPEAAWTFGGKPLAAVQHQPPPEALAQFGRPEPVRLRLLFEPTLNNPETIERAAIPVSGVRADVLLISGLDDQMGPADIAGDMLLERLARSGHAGLRLHLKYPEAGHVIGIPYTPTSMRLRPWRFAYGGTTAGYARADAESWPLVLRFLRREELR